METLAIAKKTYRLTKFGFWIALGAAVFVGVQVREMTNQSEILASQSEGANAGALMDEMNTRRQLAIAQQQAKAAQDGVDAIRKQMRQDQRAWIKITSNDPMGTGGGYPVVTPVHIINTGKTPALNYVLESLIKILPIKQEPVFDYSQGDHGRNNGGILYPADTRDMEASTYAKDAWTKPQPEKLALSRTDYERFLAGKNYIIVYARVTYWDIFGVKHWTHFCNWSTYAPRTPATKCSEYNRVDGN